MIWLSKFNNMDLKSAVNFIFELDQLAKKNDAGWSLLGIDRPNSMSDHILRATQISYLLAVLESSNNPERAAMMTLFHDNGKTRIGDQNKVTAKYMFKKEAEELAFADQIEGINKDLKNKLLAYVKEFEEKNTREAVIAQDADWLEQAFQAKEFYDLGNTGAMVWINNIEKALQTNTAKLLIKELKKTKFTDWWQGLMMMTYKN